ncbi:MAG: hypothetical protein L3J03_08090 [Desulfobacterales bacterium]|nr:hypothetical protein [Desulfobacterales bacterium]
MTAIFLASFPTGATALAFCPEGQKIQLVDRQYLHPADCHSPVEAAGPLFYEYRSAMAGQGNNDCIDISLANSKSLIRPPEKVLPVPANILFPGVLIDSRQGFRQKTADRMSFVLNQARTPSHPVTAQRTVVLLI